MMPKQFIASDLAREMATLIVRCNDIRARLIITQRQIERQAKALAALRKQVNRHAAKLMAATPQTQARHPARPEPPPSEPGGRAPRRASH